MKPTLPALAAFLVATAAFAHTGVKDADVMARMHGMKSMGKDLAILGNMARGKQPFDADIAETARQSMLAATNRVPVLFEPEARDPKDEARPEIWSNWSDFLKKNDALTDALQTSDLSDTAQLRQSLQRIGAACQACHTDYRVER